MFGLLTYLWTFYNHPPGRWWGENLPDLRWSLVAAFITLIASTLRKPNTSQAPWYQNGGAVCLICFTTWMWIQSLWSINPLHSEGCILFSKYILLFYLVYRIASDVESVEIFSWGHAAGCFIFGWIGFRDPVIGRLETVGGPGVDDANVLGAHLITGVAFAGFMFLGTSGKRRWIALAFIPFILNAIILTRSRGAFVGLLAAGLAAWYLAPKGLRRSFYLAAPLAAVLLFRLADMGFWQRIDTIEIKTSGEIEEASAQSRGEIIRANWHMFKDHPMGTGYRGNLILSPKYIAPKYLSSGTDLRAAHNTLMAVLVDEGLPGAFIFGALLFWIAYTVWRLRALDRLGLAPPLGKYGAAIGVSLAGLFISGQFLNLLTAEVQIWLIAMLAALNSMYRQSLLESKQQQSIVLESGILSRDPIFVSGRS